MTTSTVRKATSSDLETVMSLLDERITWLTDRKISQWRNRDFRETTERTIHHGFTWIAYQDELPVGTLTLSTIADPDFWTKDERTQPALYLSKMATAMTHKGAGLGKDLIYWALTYAQSMGIPRVRWDAWRDNQALIRYYATIASHLRTEAPSHRQSGALFELAWRDVQTTFTSIDKSHAYHVPDQRREVYYPTEDEPAGEQPLRIHVLDELICPPLYIEHQSEPVALTAGCTPDSESVSHVTVFHNGDHWRAHAFFGHEITKWPELESCEPGTPYNLIHKTGPDGCAMYLHSFA